MEIFACPKEVPVPEPDYANYDYELERQKEKAHFEQLKQWLINAGYTHPLTGEIYRSQIADGYAMYMFAGGPRGMCLVHLPYSDAYHDPDVQYLPAEEVIRRINVRKKVDALFSKESE